MSSNGFYSTALTLDARATPYGKSGNKRKMVELDKVDGKKLAIGTIDGTKVIAPNAIMNENAAVDYRTMYNGYILALPDEGDAAFTLYSDYEKCMSANAILKEYIDDAKNPTIHNILKYYNGETKQFDPHGLARYKIQDFIYCKWYGKIPNNQLITLRRYTMPTSDHMFGFDLEPAIINQLNGYPDSYFCLATAVTWMGEQTGNNLSDILKFSYGQKYAEKQSSVETLQNPDGGLAAQLSKRGMSDEFMGAMGGIGNAGLFAAAVMAKGKTVDQAFAARNSWEGDAYLTRYPDGVLGPVNRVDTVIAREEGLTFSNEFSLTFEYDLKSLQMISPKVAMLDILANFMLLTGNYGAFWGGMTRYIGGQKNIAPAFGKPELLRQAKFGEYLSSVWSDVQTGFDTLRKDPKGGQKSIFETIMDVIKGGAEAVLGNLIGGNLGPMSSAQMPKALLSGDPTGNWHVVIGNPLNPIVTMGNICIENTEVELGPILGADDFPTSIKFTCTCKHGRGKDIADIQSMFNAGKGRIYQYTTDVEKALNSSSAAAADIYKHAKKGNKGGGKNGVNSALEYATDKASVAANSTMSGVTQLTRKVANAINFNPS